MIFQFALKVLCLRESAVSQRSSFRTIDQLRRAVHKLDGVLPGGYLESSAAVPGSEGNGAATVDPEIECPRLELFRGYLDAVDGVDFEGQA